MPPIAIPHYKNSPEYRNKPQLRGYYYGFNITKPPFDNILVRRALAHSINRSLIPKILKGGELAASSFGYLRECFWVLKRGGLAQNLIRKKPGRYSQMRDI
ncbi:MAG: hypothetical protein Ct9H300mP23_07090 [Nitrospinota bacterium]|nr:MAG: hypothetical protein Ct9H300mP23_07090 [Nitrospinota bacterium]